MSKRDRQAWMWAEACEMLEQAERLQRQYFRLGGATRTVSWEPPVDLVDDGSYVLLTVALPGVTPDQVSLRMDGDGVLIEAIRSPGLNAFAAAVHRMEIPYGRFVRRVALPPGTYELQEQLFQHGCLNLRFARVR